MSSGPEKCPRVGPGGRTFSLSYRLRPVRIRDAPPTTRADPATGTSSDGPPVSGRVTSSGIVAARRASPRVSPPDSFRCTRGSSYGAVAQIAKTTTLQSPENGSSSIATAKTDVSRGVRLSTTTFASSFGLLPEVPLKMS